MTNMALFERLKNLPSEHPFPGLSLVTITEKPLIKMLAQLAGFWTTMRRAVALIKEVSSSQELECGTTMMFDRLDAKGTWCLVDASAKKGQLTHIKAVCCVPESGAAEELCVRFGDELMEQFHAARKAMKDATVIAI